MTESVLDVSHLQVRLESRGSEIVPVDGVSFGLRSGRTLGLIGESGSGKTTVARAIVGLARATSGTVSLHGKDVTNASGKDRKFLRQKVRLIFQDPYGSLNLRMTVGSCLLEALPGSSQTDRDTRRDQVTSLLAQVGLESDFAGRYPGALSGGQRQRVALARAIAAEPDVLILDEITSSLDVSVQIAVLNLLKDLQQRKGLSFLMISHDMSVIKYMCDDVAVMYFGRIIEDGSAETVLAEPSHPYARCLVDAVPALGQRLETPRLRALGEPPDPHSLPTGCLFHTRCPVGPETDPTREDCVEIKPELVANSDGLRRVACHYPLSGLTDLPSRKLIPRK